MERFNKKLILITIFTCILLLSGCSKIRFGTYNAADDEIKTGTELKQDDSQTAVTTEEVMDDAEVKESSDANETEEKNPKSIKPSQSNIQPVANTELMIYTINVDSGDIEAGTALIPEGENITPELIVTTVVDSMADQSIMVGVESVTTKDDAVIVSFYADQPPLKDVGAGIEAAILDAIAQSLADNLEDYSKVIYRVEGKAYLSGHIELGIDEVYLQNN